LGVAGLWQNRAKSLALFSTSAARALRHTVSQLKQLDTVDDTIHFLTCYQEEQKKTNDISTAIRRAFVSVGTALIMTTLVLVAGFCTALISDTRDHQIFASMAMLTIGAALFADLILLPALLMFFPGKQDSRQANSSHSLLHPAKGPG
jgi:cytochrome c biogenesis protein CcdA